MNILVLAAHLAFLFSGPQYQYSMLAGILCPLDAGPDTLVCGFAYELRGSEDNGSWTLLCSLSAGVVHFGNALTDTTDVKVNRCGEYVFEYSVPDGPCAGLDTVVVRFEDSGFTSLDYDLQFSLELDAPCHGSPGGITCDNEIDINGVTPPVLKWDICGFLFCEGVSFTTDPGNIVDSCQVDAMVCDSVLFSDNGMNCVSVDDLDPGDLLEILTTVLDIQHNCPIPLQCFPPPPECFEEVYDTLEVEVPELDSGRWHFVAMNDSLIALMDTTIITIDDQDYALIIQPAADYYGPGNIHVILWEVSGGGNWVEPTEQVDLFLQWDQGYIYDTLTIIDTLYVLKDSCDVIPCGGVNVNPANIDIPTPPPYPCGPVNLSFGVTSNDEFYIFELSCFDPEIAIEVCPGQIEFFNYPGIFPFTCVNGSGCPFDVTVEIFGQFQFPEIQDVVTGCANSVDEYSVSFVVTGGSGLVEVVGIGSFPYGQEIYIEGIPSCSQYDIIVRDQFSGCMDNEAVTHCCCVPQSIELDTTICDGQSIFFNGQELDETGIYQESWLDQLGCDSILTLNLVVEPVITTSFSEVLCAGQTWTFGDLELNEAGIYSDTLMSANGCDSIIELTLLLSEISFDAEAEADCWNGSTGSIVVQGITGGVPPYSATLNGQPGHLDSILGGIEAGMYQVSVYDAAGCSSETEISVPEIAPLDIPSTLSFQGCEGIPVTVDLRPSSLDTADVTLIWLDGFEENVREFTSAGVYMARLANACESLDVSVEVAFGPPSLADKIYVPNVFSPNGDGTNDQFRAFAAVPLESFEMRLYSRWGEELRRLQSIEEYWDGSFLEQTMQPGMYVWWLKARGLTCTGEVENVVLKGDVTLLK